jgi:hypothetical protein
MKTLCIGSVRVFAVIALGMTFGSALSAAQVNVTTWHNDNYRTGQNIQEPHLTVAVVRDTSKFGKTCSLTLDGQSQARGAPGPSYSNFPQPSTYGAAASDE